MARRSKKKNSDAQFWGWFLIFVGLVGGSWAFITVGIFVLLYYGDR